MSLFAGSSGWSYPTWKPGFYRQDTAPEEFLGFYASRLHAVELNSTGYRLPAEEQFRRWASQVPDGFRFAVKMPPQAIRRFDVFQERVGSLGASLGCIRIVVETPRDEGLLSLLLGSADPALRLAFDLRDPSWDGVESRLGEAGAVRVDHWDAPADWRYVRFRKPPYGDDDLAAVADRIRPQLKGGLDVFAFFKHEDEPTAPGYALRLRELVAG
jgi:uncharacterized protein YecE (DUF72 family)